jgi:hypothetical protein
MTKVLIHYGMPKTGSSSIQHSFYNKLNNEGHYYGDLGAANAGNFLVDLLEDNPEKFRHNREVLRKNASHKVDKPTFWASIAREVGYTNKRTLVISAEKFFNLKEASFKKLVDWLYERDCEIYAAGYIRSPISYIESLIQQRIKGGVADIDVNRHYPQYRAKLEKFERLLGLGNIAYWSFLPANFPGQCVVRDFVARAGISFDVNDIVHKNESLSLPTLRLLYIYNKYRDHHGYSRDDRTGMAKLIDAMKGIRGEKFRLHSSVARSLIENNRGDIEWIEGRLGVSFNEQITDSDSAIHHDSQLLSVSDQEIVWLQQQSLAYGLSANYSATALDDIAKGVHMLRLALSSRHKRN